MGSPQPLHDRAVENIRYIRDAMERAGLARPGLAVVMVGDHAASAVYVRNKRRACAEVGMFSETFPLPATVSQSEVLALVQKLNQDNRFHGILVQLPLPRQIDPKKVIDAIDPAKDVDGFHPHNVGMLHLGRPTLVPCTPAGIQAMLLHYGIDIGAPRGTVVRAAADGVVSRSSSGNAIVSVCMLSMRVSFLRSSSRSMLTRRSSSRASASARIVSSRPSPSDFRRCC